VERSVFFLRFHENRNIRISAFSQREKMLVRLSGSVGIADL
jgi:hypothetical protein